MAERPEGRAPLSLCCDASAVPCDIAAVEILLRLKLAALRAGCLLRVQDASNELLDLIAFMGLDDVLAE